MPIRFADFCSFLAFSLVWSTETPAWAVDPAQGAALFRAVCATCHGSNGEGKQELFAPPLAGMPAWYVRTQLEKFRLGYRGLPPDHAGAVMRSITLALSPAALSALAEFAGSLDSLPHPATRPAEPGWTAEYYSETCAPCHRYNGRGDQAFASAPLAVLPAWYLETSLQKFRDRVRGGHSRDEAGKKMQAAVARLSDEKIRELVAYINRLATRYPQGQLPKAQPTGNGTNSR